MSSSKLISVLLLCGGGGGSINIMNHRQLGMVDGFSPSLSSLSSSSLSSSTTTTTTTATTTSAAVSKTSTVLFSDYLSNLEGKKPSSSGYSGALEPDASFEGGNRNTMPSSSSFSEQPVELDNNFIYQPPRPQQQFSPQPWQTQPPQPAQAAAGDVAAAPSPSPPSFGTGMSYLESLSQGANGGFDTASAYASIATPPVPAAQEQMSYASMSGLYAPPSGAVEQQEEEKEEEVVEYQPEPIMMVEEPEPEMVMASVFEPEPEQPEPELVVAVAAPAAVVTPPTNVAAKAEPIKMDSSPTLSIQSPTISLTIPASLKPPKLQKPKDISYGEASRKFRRDVYSHDDWVRHRSADRFLRNLNSIVTSGVYKVRERKRENNQRGRRKK
jgi:hypothetical protein